MARIKNIIEKAESMTGKIPQEYQLSIEQVVELHNAFSYDWFRMITNGFRLGYMQGMKKKKKEIQRKGRLND